jgi:hypothetical protein
LSTEILTKPRAEFWRVAVCLVVGAYLATGAATNSIRFYHWFMLLAIPVAVLSGERGRRFFLDWAPLFAFWLIYDRLRLFQSLLYDRVDVATAFHIERWAFGWMTAGTVPAHAAHAWLANTGGTLARSIEWSAQAVYFSHLFFLPLFIFSLWLLGERRAGFRESFRRHMLAFSLLNFAGIAFYVLLPVAPPWWVTLNGMAGPTVDSVAHANMASAMSGNLIRGMIKNAAQQFAAVPSLHGAYPVLLLLLFPRKKNWLAMMTLAMYGCAMWAATVVLNQHYIIDLVAGAVLAVAAWRVEALLRKRRA